MTAILGMVFSVYVSLYLPLQISGLAGGPSNLDRVPLTLILFNARRHTTYKQQ